MVRKWNNIDWKWRICIAALSVYIFTAFSVALVFSNLNKGNQRDSLIAQASILGDWLAERDGDLLKKEEDILRQSHVLQAVIFAPDAQVVMPASMRGRKFGDISLFNKLLSGDVTSKLDDKGNLEMFRPVVGSSGNPEGLIFLKLAASDNYSWMLFVLLGGVLMLVAGFVYWILWETGRSVGIEAGKLAPRFELFRKKVENVSLLQSKKLIRHFEDDWRRLIHMLSEPVIILDNNCRLKEMNRTAVNEFGGGAVSEGSHLLDVLREDALKNSITRALKDLKNAPREKVCLESGSSKISLFASSGVLPNFKYTLVCSKVG